jgi:hypothetical protein
MTGIGACGVVGEMTFVVFVAQRSLERPGNGG